MSARCAAPLRHPTPLRRGQGAGDRKVRATQPSMRRRAARSRATQPWRRRAAAHLDEMQPPARFVRQAARPVRRHRTHVGGEIDKLDQRATDVCTQRASERVCEPLRTFSRPRRGARVPRHAPIAKWRSSSAFWRGSAIQGAARGVEAAMAATSSAGRRGAATLGSPCGGCCGAGASSMFTSRRSSSSLPIDGERVMAGGLVTAAGRCCDESPSWPGSPTLS